MAAGYPQVKVDKFHIDILTAHFVQRPEFFDVVVASNLFGDILSDLGPACTGTIGIAPSANINPERTAPSLFEPVHGSAPDIAGQGIANPIGQIWSGALMLEARASWAGRGGGGAVAGRRSGAAGGAGPCAAHARHRRQRRDRGSRGGDRAGGGFGLSGRIRWGRPNCRPRVTPIGAGGYGVLRPRVRPSFTAR